MRARLAAEAEAAKIEVDRLAIEAEVAKKMKQIDQVLRATTYCWPMLLELRLNGFATEAEDARLS
jgi:hypothetical protein